MILLDKHSSPYKKDEIKVHLQLLIIYYLNLTCMQPPEKPAG